jgi:hypothetical protein
LARSDVSAAVERACPAGAAASLGEEKSRVEGTVFGSARPFR